jgi:transcriptional regulator with XRE-family HTH domain
MTTIIAMEKTRDSVGFGRRLKQARQRRQLSQKELAAMIEVHPRQVSKYEMGTSYPTVAKLLEIVRTLKIRPEELLADIEPQPEEQLSNLRLLQRFKDLEQLPRHDQDTIVELIDAVVARGKIRKVVVG